MGEDLLTIATGAPYFIPQIETKIMNEGWASFFHKRILDALQLPQELHLEFLVRHNQVVRPIPGSLNPYHLGLKLWEDIERRGDHPTPDERENLPPGPPDVAHLPDAPGIDRERPSSALAPRACSASSPLRYEAKGDDLS